MNLLIMYIFHSNLIPISNYVMCHINKKDLNNFRPISKLPCLAKMLESVVNEQLTTLLHTML